MIDWKLLTTRKYWLGAVKDFVSFWLFFGLIILSMISRLFSLVSKIPLLGSVLEKFGDISGIRKGFNILIEFFDKGLNGSTIKRSYLINLAFSNMGLKKTRSIMTVVGMAVGVGSIVFLISVGFGLEKLVISRVARLDDLKMADISPGDSVSLKLNDEVRKKIMNINNVEKVLPLVSMVGKVRYESSMIDVMTYGIQADYFPSVGIKASNGKLFEDNNLSWIDKPDGQVAGISRDLTEGELGKKIESDYLNFNLNPGEVIEVYEDTDLSIVVGYIGWIEGGYWGEEYWGSYYKSENGNGECGVNQIDGRILGKLIKTKVKLLRKEGDTYVPILDKLGRNVWEIGYIKNEGINIFERYIVEGSIFGETKVASQSAIEFESVVATDSASGVEWVQMKLGGKEKKLVDAVSFNGEVSKEAVISKAMARLFGDGDNVVGKEFIVSYILTSGLVPGLSEKTMTEEESYKVLGVIDDETSAYFYVPIGDVLKAGVTNFSQMRLVSSKNDSLPSIRKEVETLGYKTTSTVDTVAEIEKLFGNARVLLGLLGFMALGVAVLGMFNTLTVSLLERTREIGGMKAMGMLSVEIRDLLLAEAMIMGLSGGLAGLIFGFTGGEILSLLLTLFSLAKGQGEINISYLPLYFVGFIIVMSFAVGLLTGLYPARRAKMISALNALRYE